MIRRQPFSAPPLGPPRSSARERVLAAWRGIDLVPVEVAARSAEKAPAAVLPKLLGTLRIEQRKSEAEIVRIWNHLLDPTVVAHAHPTGLHEGTLFVTVDSSPWLNELVRYRRKEILDRLQHSVGRQLIQRISFRVG